MSPFVTLGPLTIRNEQCIALYPLTTHYSIWQFPAHVTFWPSQGPFILGLISRIRVLTARYWPFLIVGQIKPVVIVGPFVADYQLGHFHSVIKYSLLMSRYG